MPSGAFVLDAFTPKAPENTVCLKPSNAYFCSYLTILYA